MGCNAALAKIPGFYARCVPWNLSRSSLRILIKSSGRPMARWLSLYSSTLATMRRRVSTLMPFSAAISSSISRKRLSSLKSAFMMTPFCRLTMRATPRPSSGSRAAFHIC